MDAKESPVITLKVLIDKERNQVVYAESDNHFVDVLFSFLTLPMGTVVRLLRKEEPQQSAMGCMSNLYQSIENLDVKYFQTGMKEKLLRPSNPSLPYCRRLKVNIDDTQPITYYFCPICLHGNQVQYATVRPGTYCPKHGIEKTKEMLGKLPPITEGMFVKERSTYMITDDLHVMPCSVVTSLEHLLKFCIQDVDLLEEKKVDIGKREVLFLLRHSLSSKALLKDLILREQVGSSEVLTLQQEVEAQLPRNANTPNNWKQFSLKIMVIKSNNKILYAEAQEDFINYLLSFLAMTLGSVVKLLDKTPTLNGISNLYKSVDSLSIDRYMTSKDLKATLLSPKLGVQTLGSNGTTIQMMSDGFMNIQVEPSSIYMNMDSPTLNTLGNHAFIKGPATYVVTDDLIVTPLSPISSISFLNHLKVPITDLEVRVANFGQEQARRLLEASLISKSALTMAFNFNSCKKKPKIEK